MTRSPVDIPGGTRLLITSAGLQARYERRGDRKDIDKAIEFGRAAVAALAGHPSEASALTALGIGLRARFDPSSHPGDIDEAVEVLQRALDLTGPRAAATELLERGRAVLWAQQMSPRVAVPQLRAAHPELADRLDAIRRQLDV